MVESFGVVTINHGRPRIFELWCAHIKRLRYDTGIYIPVMCVSGAEDKATCQKYHIEHMTQENNPVSFKWNTAFKYMRDIGIEYVIMLGSDDIISTGLLRNLIKEMEKGTSVIGVDTVYFYSSEGQFKGEMVRFKTKIILGVAKTIHKSVLDPIAWHVCPTAKNWGIDHGIIGKAINPHVTTKAIVEGVVVDVKSSVNINKWTAFGKSRPRVDAKIFYNILGDEEKQLLSKI